MNLSISEKLFLLSSKPKGSSTTYHANVAMMEGCLADLFLENAITVIDGKLICNERNNHLSGLQTVVDYINNLPEKRRKIKTAFPNLTMRFKAYNKSIYNNIANGLLDAGLLTDHGQKGIFIKYENYFPDLNVRNQIIDQIKLALIDNEREPDIQTLILANIILNGSIAQRYFKHKQIKILLRNVKDNYLKNQYHNIFEMLKIVEQDVIGEQIAINTVISNNNIQF